MQFIIPNFYNDIVVSSLLYLFSFLFKLFLLRKSSEEIKCMFPFNVCYCMCVLFFFSNCIFYYEMYKTSLYSFFKINSKERKNLYGQQLYMYISKYYCTKPSVKRKTKLLIIICLCIGQYYTGNTDFENCYCF